MPGKDGYPGPLGERGDHGYPGPKGMPGRGRPIQGPPGESGRPGIPGIVGDHGLPGYDGIPGFKGKRGDDCGVCSPGNINYKYFFLTYYSYLTYHSS